MTALLGFAICFGALIWVLAPLFRGGPSAERRAPSAGFCPSCGAVLESAANYCSECGASLAG